MTVAAEKTTLGSSDRQHGTRRPAERTLVSYLLLPRPGDVGKAVIFPTGFAIGLLAVGTHRHTPLSAVCMVWIVLEFLIYQSRYQWNDIRGFAADRANPQRGARGRLPEHGVAGLSSVTASRLVAIGRLSLALVVAVAIDNLQVLEMTVVLAVAVFAIAWIYETLKQHGRHRGGTNRSLPPAVLSIWGFVGAGYAIRGIGGLAMAVTLNDRPWLAGAAVVTCWLAGIGFVTSRWAVEATGFARFAGRSVQWYAPADAARDHLLALTRWLPAERTADDAQAIQDPSHWRVLARRTRFSAPWNLATTAAAAAAAVTGGLMSGELDLNGALPLALVGAVTAAGVVAHPALRWVSIPVGAVILLGTAAWVVGASGSWRAVLPWLIVTALYARSTSQSRDCLRPPFQRLLATIRPSR